MSVPATSPPEDYSYQAASSTIPPSTPDPTKPDKPHSCLTAFLGFMLVVFLMLTLVFLNLRLTVFSPTFWKNWLDKSDAYELVQEILIPNIFTGFTGSGDDFNSKIPAEGQVLVFEDETAGEFATGENYDVYNELDDELTSATSPENTELSPESLEAITNLVQKSVTPEWMQQQAEVAIDEFFAWVHGDKEDLRIVFDLSPLQGSFATGMIDVLEIEYEKLPLCPTDFSDVDPAELESMQCRYEGVDFDKVREEYAKQNPEELGFGNIPNKYVIDEKVFSGIWNSSDEDLTGTSKDISDSMANPPHFFKVYCVILWISVALTALFAGLIILVYRKNVVAMLRTLGITILIPTIIALILDLVMYFATGVMTSNIAQLQNGLFSQSGNIPAEMMPANNPVLNDFALPLMSELIKSALVQIIIITVAIMTLAIIMIILGKVLANRTIASYYNRTSSETSPPV